MTAFCRDPLSLLGNEAKMMERWCIVECWRVSVFSKQVSWISGCCKNFAHHRTASDPQRSSISLTVDSAITDGAPLTRDIGRDGKQSTRQLTVCDKSYTARLVCSARKSDHVKPLLQGLHWLRVPQRIEFKLAVLAFRCLHVNCAVWQTWTLDEDFVLLRRSS